MAAGKKKDADVTGSAADGPAGVAAGDGGDGAEVSEDQVRVIERAAAIDVAKGSGMVCTRVPGSRPDRRRQKVWQVTATYREVRRPPLGHVLATAHDMSREYRVMTALHGTEVPVPATYALRADAEARQWSAALRTRHDHPVKSGHACD
jgi:aminoglycoside phosphotransferase (APT) family kinase protein